MAKKKGKGGYGLPPQQQHAGTSPQQQQYGGPPPQQKKVGTPPQQQQNVGTQPQQQHAVTPSQQQQHAETPPQQQQYDGPPPQQRRGPPPQQQQYGGSPPQQQQHGGPQQKQGDCGGGGQVPKLQRKSEGVVSQTDIGLRLLKHILCVEGKDGNIIMSPASIIVILSLIASGSKSSTLPELFGFKSAKDMRSLALELFSGGSPVDGPLISLANGAWIDESIPFESAFKRLLTDSYKVAVFTADFENKVSDAIEEVNSWVAKETGGLVHSLLPRESISRETKLIFANALSFKGKWRFRFDISMTKDHDFHLLDGSSVRAAFMTSMRNQLVECHQGFKVLGLRYSQGEDEKRRFTMYILLPDATDGLSSLVCEVTEPGFLDRHLPSQERPLGEFRVPKFKITSGFKLSPVLRDMGLRHLLNPDSGIKGMIQKHKQFLMVSETYHKSVIQVHEEGTEATAAMAPVMQYGCPQVDREAIDFVADRPFMFILREDVTGTILFSGQLLDPTST